MLRSRTVFELCEPEPLTVATCMLMSLTIRFCPVPPVDPRGTTSVVAIPTPSFSSRAEPNRPSYALRRGNTVIIRRRNPHRSANRPSTSPRNLHGKPQTFEDLRLGEELGDMAELIIS